MECPACRTCPPCGTLTAHSNQEAPMANTAVNKKTSVRVDPATWTKIRLLAVQEHRPIADLLAEMVKVYAQSKKGGTA